MTVTTRWTCKGRQVTTTNRPREQSVTSKERALAYALSLSPCGLHTTNQARHSSPIVLRVSGRLNRPYLFPSNNNSKRQLANHSTWRKRPANGGRTENGNCCFQLQQRPVGNYFLWLGFENVDCSPHDHNSSWLHSITPREPFTQHYMPFDSLRHASIDTPALPTCCQLLPVSSTSPKLPLRVLGISTSAGSHKVPSERRLNILLKTKSVGKIFLPDDWMTE